MIEMVYETDPFLCECGGHFKVIAVIEGRSQYDLVGKILKHIKYLFDVRQLPDAH